MDPPLAIKGGFGWEIGCRRLRQVTAFQALPVTPHDAWQRAWLENVVQSLHACITHGGDRPCPLTRKAWGRGFYLVEFVS